MGVASELEKEINSIFKEKWVVRNGNVVPDVDSLKLSNEGVKFDATVLYADLADSTLLVDNYKPEFAAEVYKVFLRCCCRMITANDGSVTAFDGDRVMAIFIGDHKNTNAVKAALQIHWAITQVANPCLASCYPSTQYKIAYGVGIDTSSIMAARTGIRGSNDLVWVGPAANYAAKMNSLQQDDYVTWISQAVFDRLNKVVKLDSRGNSIWESRVWSKYNKTVYRSNHWWNLD